MLRPALITFALLTSSHAALAQQQVPDAGRQIRQIPPPPQVQKPAPDISIERGGASADLADAGITVRVDALRVTGQTLFPESELIAATGFTPGRELSLSALREIAAKITAFYNARGYFLAQAYLPAQDIRDGVVRIAVIEGRYGSIELRNDSNLSDGVARGVLGGLEEGDLVATRQLERRLLLLSDIPGIAVRSTLSPGATVGTSNLIVDVQPGRRVTGSVEADNSGNRYTGAYRLSGTVNINNPAGLGDVLSLRALASTSGGLLYGRASYQAQLGVATVGAAFAHIDYELGREFKALDAEGTADVASLFASYPLIRSRDTNLYALVGGEAKWFKDRAGAAGTVSNKQAQVVSAGLEGDHHDDFGGGGWSNLSLGVVAGKLDIENPVDLAIDRLTARRNGGYGKLQVAVARLQSVAGPLSLYAAVRAQLATKNLDSSEQMSLGGAYGVRAYPEGEAYGDEGYLANFEARLTLPDVTGVPGRVQLFGFIDTGTVRLAKNPWLTGSNRASRSGIGAGISWASDNDFLVKASYARKLGDADATSAPDRSGRAWFQIVKLF